MLTEIFLLVPYLSNHVIEAAVKAPIANSNSKTFDELLQTEEGNMVIINLGSKSERLGIINNDTDGSSPLLNQAHIQTIYAPNHKKSDLPG
nr:hypothetical protein [Paenibacillus sp. BC26]